MTESQERNLILIVSIVGILTAIYAVYLTLSTRSTSTASTSTPAATSTTVSATVTTASAASVSLLEAYKQVAGPTTTAWVFVVSIAPNATVQSGTALNYTVKVSDTAFNLVSMISWVGDGNCAQPGQASTSVSSLLRSTPYDTQTLLPVNGDNTSFLATVIMNGQQQHTNRITIYTSR